VLRVPVDEISAWVPDEPAGADWPVASRHEHRLRSELPVPKAPCGLVM
jgi:hypothetical protein